MTDETWREMPRRVRRDGKVPSFVRPPGPATCPECGDYLFLFATTADGLPDTPELSWRTVLIDSEQLEDVPGAATACPGCDVVFDADGDRLTDWDPSGRSVVTEVVRGSTVADPAMFVIDHMPLEGTDWLAGRKRLAWRARWTGDGALAVQAAARASYLARCDDDLEEAEAAARVAIAGLDGDVGAAEIAAAHAEMAYCLDTKGSHADSLPHWDIALAAAEQAGDDQELAWLRADASVAVAAIRDEDEALQMIAAAVPVLEASGDRDVAAEAADHAYEVALEQGDDVTALRWGLSATKNHRRDPDFPSNPEANLSFAKDLLEGLEADPVRHGQALDVLREWAEGLNPDFPCDRPGLDAAGELLTRHRHHI